MTPNRRKMVAATAGLGVLLISGVAAAQSQLVEAINAAGRAARAGENVSAMARLIELAGADEVNTLKAALEGGTADAAVITALKNNAFLPHNDSFGTAITGPLSNGVITDRVSGMQYRVVGGVTSGWGSSDLFGFDGMVVTVWGPTGVSGGNPAIALRQMAPGESAAYVHGRLRGTVVNDKPVISIGSGNNATQIVIDNPQFAQIMTEWASRSRGGVGVIVPGQVVEEGGQLLLKTGGDTGVPDVPEFWVLTDLYGNGFGRAPLVGAPQPFLYNAEVYGSNSSVATVGPDVPNQQARHAMFGQPVGSLDELGVEATDYTAPADSPVNANTTWNPGVASTKGNANGDPTPRRFFIARRVTPDLNNSSYVNGSLDAGSNVERLDTQLIDPGTGRGMDGSVTASTPAGAEVQTALSRSGGDS